MRLPVRSLQAHELVLLERHFADVPRSMPRPVKCLSPGADTESPLHRHQAEWEAQVLSNEKDLGGFDVPKYSGEYVVP